MERISTGNAVLDAFFDGGYGGYPVGRLVLIEGDDIAALSALLRTTEAHKTRYQSALPGSCYALCAKESRPAYVVWTDNGEFYADPFRKDIRYEAYVYLKLKGTQLTVVKDMTLARSGQVVDLATDTVESVQEFLRDLYHEVNE